MEAETLAPAKARLPARTVEAIAMLFAQGVVDVWVFKGPEDHQNMRSLLLRYLNVRTLTLVDASLLYLGGRRGSSHVRREPSRPIPGARQWGSATGASYQERRKPGPPVPRQVLVPACPFSESNANSIPVISPTSAEAVSTVQWRLSSPYRTPWNPCWQQGGPRGVARRP